MRFKDTCLIREASNSSMVAFHIGIKKVCGICPTLFLCKIMFVPWLSKGLAIIAGQRFDLAAHIIELDLGRGIVGRREYIPDVKGIWYRVGVDWINMILMQVYFLGNGICLTNILLSI